MRYSLTLRVDLKDQSEGLSVFIINECLGVFIIKMKCLSVFTILQKGISFVSGMYLRSSFAMFACFDKRKKESMHISDAAMHACLLFVCLNYLHACFT